MRLIYDSFNVREECHSENSMEAAHDKSAQRSIVVTPSLGVMVNASGVWRDCQSPGRIVKRIEKVIWIDSYAVYALLAVIWV